MSTATAHLSPEARQQISDAWLSGGCKSVAELLGMDQSHAGRIVSNLRRSNPDLFPRRRLKIIPSRRRLIREAIQIVEAMPQTAATALVIHLLHNAMPKGKKQP